MLSKFITSLITVLFSFSFIQAYAQPTQAASEQVGGNITYKAKKDSKKDKKNKKDGKKNKEKKK